jgi:phosphate transport system protein
MADLAVRGLEDCKAALTTGDTRVAYSAILRDSRIDDLETQIDTMCVEFMVRHIPVAKHLRFAHSVAKIISELERVGDYSESINRQAILLGGSSEETGDLSKFDDLAQVAIEMIQQAMRAFLDEDIELTHRTRALDKKANELHQEIYRELCSRKPKDADGMSILFSLLSVANRLERVADQAKNISDEVSYILTGETVKHVLQRDLKILFVSSSNSCRGMMAEGIAETIAGDHFSCQSAGIDTDRPDPGAIEFLKTRGIDISNHESRTLADVSGLENFKAIVAIGKEAAQQLSANTALGYRSILLEWETKNPADVEAESTEEVDGYAVVFDELVSRISALIRALHGSPLSAPSAKGD